MKLKSKNIYASIDKITVNKLKFILITIITKLDPFLFTTSYLLRVLIAPNGLNIIADVFNI